MQTTSITSKGQIVIPAAVRRRFGITEGTRFTVETDEAAGRIILIPITRAYVERLRGRFRGGLLAALAAEKRREKER